MNLFFTNLYVLTKLRISTFNTNLFFKSIFEIKKNRVHIKNLRKNGYSVVENYYSPEVCNGIRKVIDDAIATRPELLWLDCLHSDKRIFHAQDLDQSLLSFFKDDFLLEIGKEYYSAPLENLQTLAARLDYALGNLGSGDGWHRDAINKQFKSILYLVDVDDKSGPFEIFPGSHGFFQILLDSFVMNISVLRDRFTLSQIDMLNLKRGPIKIEGKAGTLLLVDTSAIHRGSPILCGSRHSLTNYYYPPQEITGRKDDFKPRKY